MTAVPEKSAPKHVAPNTNISYDPELVAKLEADHKRLLMMFTAITKMAEKEEFHKIPKALNTFRRTLNAHLLLENVKLYIYLKNCLASDPASLELMTGMQVEMQAIARAVAKFLKKYITLSWTPEMKRDFAKELARVGSILVDRIDSEEETLYSLYMTPDNF